MCIDTWSDGIETRDREGGTTPDGGILPAAAECVRHKSLCHCVVSKVQYNLRYLHLIRNATFTKHRRTPLVTDLSQHPLHLLLVHKLSVWHFSPDLKNPSLNCRDFSHRATGSVAIEPSTSLFAPDASASEEDEEGNWEVAVAEALGVVLGKETRGINAVAVRCGCAENM